MFCYTKTGELHNKQPRITLALESHGLLSLEMDWFYYFFSEISLILRKPDPLAKFLGSNFGQLKISGVKTPLQGHMEPDGVLTQPSLNLQQNLLQVPKVFGSHQAFYIFN